MHYDTMVWLSQGNPLVLNELSKMPMLEYFALLNKKIAEQRAQMKSLKKFKR